MNVAMVQQIARKRCNVGKEELSKYITYKKRTEKLQNDIAELEEQDIETVAGKVKGSMKEHPYTERRFSVQMELPEEAERICKQIAKKKQEMEELEARMREIEHFIDDNDDVYMKSIFEYRYLEGMSTEELAKKYGYTKGRISQIVSNYLKKTII
ncbi:MAG: hypothetical protein II992_03380 [Lachnospiraceae bacterium]|nr:hypothetical protein [Lachnospiraceae bacterium]